MEKDQSDPKEEMRFLKQFQYRTAYYALLLDAAIIALFRTAITDIKFPTEWLFSVVKLIGSVIVFMTGVISHMYQNENYDSMRRYRDNFDEYKKPPDDYELERWSNRIFRRKTKEKKGEFRNARTKLFYTSVLKFLAWIGAIAAIIIIWS